MDRTIELMDHNVAALAQDDLLDLYEKLTISCRQLKEEIDKCKQELYLERIQKKTLISTQNDLQHELDSINATHQEELQAINEKNSTTVENLRKKNRELETDKFQLEAEVEELLKQLQDWKSGCDELRTEITNQRPIPRVSDSFSKNLELENEQLNEILKEMKSKLEETEAQRSDQQSRIEELSEKILCLEDNLESKKSEIEEKNDAMESLQEKVQEATLELAMLKTAPDDANRKGNSLFAEVDDQRQKLKLIIQGERAQFHEMKKLCNVREIEIRRLKRENMNIKTEIQECTNLLMRGEQIHVQELSAQVVCLRNDNKKLEARLASTEKNLSDLAKENPSVAWVGSVLSTANDETRELKEKLFTLMIDKTALADSLSKAQRELAKARLDCVKFKMLISRIVDQNNLRLCQDDFIDIGLDEEVFDSIKTEQIEGINEQDDPMSGCSSFEMNESAIEPISEPERRKNELAMPITALKTSDNKENNVNENTETVKEHQTAVQVATPRKLAASPLQFLRVNASPKVEGLSSALETKAIDSKQEPMEQSRPTRKRPGVVVQRIIIPSKKVQSSQN